MVRRRKKRGVCDDDDDDDDSGEYKLKAAQMDSKYF